MLDDKLSLKVSIAVSVTCLILIILHAIFPKVVIDFVSIGLLLIGILPWLLPFIHSLELPGGIKIAIRYRKRLKATLKEAEKSGLLKEPRPTLNLLKAGASANCSTTDQSRNSLIELRAKLESKLRTIANAFTTGEGFENSSFEDVVWGLRKAAILKENQAIALLQLISLLNEAIHKPELDSVSVDWAMEIGPALLRSFDEL